MSDNELWLNAADLGAVRLACTHCESEATFSGTDASVPSEILCPNCKTLMAGAAELVTAYRHFIGEVTRDPRRHVRFQAYVSTPSSDTG